MALKFINICRRPGTTAQGLITLGGTAFPCALGRGGISSRKREGDGATPLATLVPLYGYRKRSLPALYTPLRMVLVRTDQGWCDAPADANYNRPVRLPYPASHERMMREDHLYDFCIVLDWNLRRRRRNSGSAIFLHIARPGHSPTEGCIAVSPAVMRRLLPHLSPRTRLRVCV